MIIVLMALILPCVNEWYFKILNFYYNYPIYDYNSTMWHCKIIKYILFKFTFDHLKLVAIDFDIHIHILNPSWTYTWHPKRTSIELKMGSYVQL